MPRHLAVQAALSLVKTALNSNLTILAQTDAVATFYTRVKLAYYIGRNTSIPSDFWILAMFILRPVVTVIGGITVSVNDY